MDDTYERQLEAVVGGLPGHPCLIALVPTIDVDQAAALAGDFAQLVGRGRPGHTLLLSLEASPAALDHEIGAEGVSGLSDILAGRITLAEGAAHGRARGYIYVPAGETPAPGEALLRSAALRSLCGSAIGRGATVLAFTPEDALSSIADAAAADDEAAETLPIEGVVWLGAAPEAGRAPSPWRTLGALLPPGSVHVPPGQGGTWTVVTGLRHRARRDRQRRRDRVIIGVLVAVFLAALGFTAFAILRPETLPSVLPENDSLWLAPPAPSLPGT